MTPTKFYIWYRKLEPVYGFFNRQLLYYTVREARCTIKAATYTAALRILVRRVKRLNKDNALRILGAWFMNDKGHWQDCHPTAPAVYLA